MKTIEKIIEEKTGFASSDFWDNTSVFYEIFFVKHNLFFARDIIEKFGWDGEVIPELEDIKEVFERKQIYINGKKGRVLKVLSFYEDIDTDKDRVGVATMVIDYDGKDEEIRLIPIHGIGSKEKLYTRKTVPDSDWKIQKKDDEANVPILCYYDSGVITIGYLKLSIDEYSAEPGKYNKEEFLKGFAEESGLLEDSKLLARLKEILPPTGDFIRPFSCCSKIRLL